MSLGYESKRIRPLIVSIDTEGNNLFLDNKAYYASRKESCEAPIIDSVKDYQKIEVQ